MGTLVDMTGVTAGFSAIPPANYVATFTDYEVHPAGPNAQHPGSPVVKMEFVVSDGGPHDGSKLWREFSLWPTALFGIKGAAIALGAPPEDWEGQFEVEQRLNDLKGNRALLVVGQREWEGEMRNDVKRVRSLEGATATAPGGAASIPF